MCTLLQDVLTDDTFVATHLPDDGPDRKILYEDPELGFCILGHVHHGAKESQPHDHGPTWAIYGQAAGVTEMTDWEVVEPATEDKPGKVRFIKTYTLTPGSADVTLGTPTTSTGTPVASARHRIHASLRTPPPVAMIRRGAPPTRSR